MSNEICQYIQAQILQAEMHSDGALTLHAGRALEKLRCSALPQSHFWLLKVVQAAVSGRAPELVVTTSESEISCSFLPELDGLDESLKILEPSPTTGYWKHLQQALWALLDQQLEFDCNLPASDRSWRYSGEKLSLLSGPQPSPGLHLKVRCGSTSELLELLSERAFLCPILVLVNGHRLEGKVTPSVVATPLHLEAIHDQDLPELPLPRGEGSLAPPYESKSTKALGVVSVHLEQRQRSWRPVPTDSFVYWFLDGVWIERQRLPFDRSSINCEIYASAEGLNTDASGIRLVGDEKRAGRYRRCLAAAGVVIQNTRLPDELRNIGKTTPPIRTLFGAMTLGLVLMLSIPSAGAWLATGGLVATLCSLPSGQQLVRELQNSLENLQIQAARSGVWP